MLLSILVPNSSGIYLFYKNPNSPTICYQTYTMKPNWRPSKFFHGADLAHGPQVETNILKKKMMEYL